MKLSGFIRQNLELILHEWDAHASVIQPKSGSMNKKELRDHAQEILLDIADGIDSSRSTQFRHERSRGIHPLLGEALKSAVDHGITRHGFGFDIHDLLSEYRALRASVLRLWAKSQHEKSAWDEITLFNEELDGVVKESIEAFSAVTDSKRKRAEENLRASEDRLRGTFENAAVGIAHVGLKGEWLRVNERLCAIVGYSCDELLGLQIHDITHPEDIDTDLRLLRQMMRGEINKYHLEKRYLRKDGQTVWGNLTTSLQHDANGNPLYGILILEDITERKRAEEQRNFLMREIDHRAKNALAVVQSVIQLTKAETIDEFIEAVKGRVVALGRTHSLLARSQWRDIDLEQMIREELEPYFSQDTNRVLLSGPTVAISPVAVQAMSMVFHELTTNAAKYGALSSVKGKVDVRWDIQDNGNLWFNWQETGVPMVIKEPKQKGFGSSLIGDAVARQLGGSVNFTWNPEGLCLDLIIDKKLISHSGTPQPTKPEIFIRPPQPKTDSLQGCRILIVEDDMIIAAGVELDLRNLGCTTVGPIGTVQEAVDLISSRDDLHAAVVDINLQGHESWPVVDALRERGIPYALATGYTDLAGTRGDAPVLEKPYSSEKLQEILQGLLKEQKD